MVILGISGLENSVGFKKEKWPGLDEREYRICQGYDSAAALVVDGVTVAAAAEERFNRRKHSGAFPSEAISFCLGQGGMALKDVDQIAHAFNYSPYREIYSLDRVSGELYERVLSREVLLSQVSRHCPGVAPEQVHQVGHHLSHAASAYFTSGWDVALGR